MLPVEPDLHLYVGLFFLVAFAVIAYFIANGAVRILYPKVIENRLKRIRNTPRISPAGNVMRKLAEEENPYTSTGPLLMNRPVLSMQQSMTCGWMKRPDTRRSKSTWVTNTPRNAVNVDSIP